MAGGSRLLFILVGVDVALGRTITLLTFDIKKKSLSALKFDVAFIALCRNEADLRYLPLRTRRTWLAAIADAKSGAVIAFLPVKLETK